MNPNPLTDEELDMTEKKLEIIAQEYLKARGRPFESFSIGAVSLRAIQELREWRRGWAEEHQKRPRA